MHESTGLGMGMCFVGRGGDGSQVYGDGWGWKKNHGDWVGMGLIFNTMSLFSLKPTFFAV